MSQDPESTQPWNRRRSAADGGDHYGQEASSAGSWAGAGNSSAEPATSPYGTVSGSTASGAGASASAQDPYATLPLSGDQAYDGTGSGYANGGYASEQHPYGTGQAAYGSDQAADGAGYGAAGYGAAGYAAGQAGTAGQDTTDRRGRKRFGTGTLITGMVLAALVGGGTAAGTAALVSDGSGSSSSGGTQSSTTIVNNTDSVNAVTAAAKKASPSTVTISVTSGQTSGTGSGVVLDDQGHILTNTHVVTLDGEVSNPSIEVQFSDGTAVKATVVGTDPTSDLAVIKVDPQKVTLTPATFGDSSKLNVGDVAVAIGAPLGLSGTVTDGILSSLSRTISVQSSAAPDSSSSNSDSDSDSGSGSGSGSSSSPFQFQFPDQNGGTQSSSSSSTIALNVIQTDAAINPGNSGGPLLNSSGEVVGINVAIASAGSSSSSQSESSSTGNIGVGFAIPVNYAKRVAQEIIDNGKATHGYLGASVSSTAAGSSSSGFTDGATISKVVSGSPADKAGLKKGDQVTEVAGQSVSDAESMTATVREQASGASVTIKYRRDGQEKTAQVTLGDASSAS